MIDSEWTSTGLGGVATFHTSSGEVKASFPSFNDYYTFISSLEKELKKANRLGKLYVCNKLQHMIQEVENG